MSHEILGWRIRQYKIKYLETESDASREGSVFEGNSKMVVGLVSVINENLIIFSVLRWYPWLTATQLLLSVMKQLVKLLNTNNTIVFMLYKFDFRARKNRTVW